jgi:two-component system, chemotaxis family, chemotaxis protein CheY
MLYKVRVPLKMGVVEASRADPARVLRLSAGTVLVLDDDPDILEALSDLLREAGYAVLSFRSGGEALVYLRDNPPPQAMLVDLFMPLMSGWEFLAQMRQNDLLAAIPVIVITATGPFWGYPVPDHMVVHKPIDIDHLLDLLASLTPPPPPDESPR